MDDEWSHLGARLLQANPDCYREIVAEVRELVKAQEILHSDDLTVILEMLRLRFREAS